MFLDTLPGESVDTASECVPCYYSLLLLPPPPTSSSNLLLVLCCIRSSCLHLSLLSTAACPHPLHCRQQLEGKVKLADFGFARSFAAVRADDGTFAPTLPVDMISREPIPMQVCCCFTSNTELCHSTTSSAHAAPPYRATLHKGANGSGGTSCPPLNAQPVALAFKATCLVWGCCFGSFALADTLVTAGLRSTTVHTTTHCVVIVGTSV